MSTTTNESRCRARTDDGSRCERQARGDGYCYQHDADDPTVDGTDGDGEGDQTAATGTSDDDHGTEATPVVEVRETVIETATSLVGHPLDNIVAITGREDGWKATVEVVERTAVPDTQDILGRYELLLDDSPIVTEYRRVGRSRRGDTGQEERA